MLDKALDKLKKGNVFIETDHKRPQEVIQLITTNGSLPTESGQSPNKSKSNFNLHFQIGYNQTALTIDS